jgi:uncharacterized protein (TIGR02598 family)
MKLRNRSISGFSLVEVTLALGIAAFCLIAVFGLMPVGVQTNRNATSQTAATNILSSVVSDIRASPKGTTATAQYRIRRGKSNITTVYFDGAGECSVDLSGSIKVDGTSWSPPLQTRYRLTVTITRNSFGSQYPADYAYLKVTWPAAVAPTITPSGSVETVATFFEK